MALVSRSDRCVPRQAPFALLCVSHKPHCRACGSVKVTLDRRTLSVFPAACTLMGALESSVDKLPSAAAGEALLAAAAVLCTLKDRKSDALPQVARQAALLFMK